MTGGEDWDREVDLLVAGAGPGGMTAALVGALEGLDVLVCEKSQLIGGTGATSAGTLWIPGNSQNREAGFADSAGDAAAYLDALIGDGGADSRRAVYLREGPKVIDDLVARSELGFVACGRHPDYRSNLPGAAIEGRAIVAETFDGRKLGADFARIRPPIPEYLLFGGMMVGKADLARLLGRYRSVANFAHSAGLVLRYLADRLRFARGTRLTMGNALVGRLYYSLKRNGVDIAFGAALGEVVERDGGAAGAAFETAEGGLRVRARRGVVLATGGMARHEALREVFMPRAEPKYSLAVAENTGDGIAAGERLGGWVESAGEGGLWTPVSRNPRKHGGTGLYPHILLDRAKPGLIAVNRAGRRFVNEAASYHDFVEGMFRADEISPSIPAWLICDAGFVRRYGLGDIHPGTAGLARHERAGYVTLGGSAAELAAKIGVDSDGLADSIRRHNRFAEEGADADFGKGDTDLNRFNGDPGNRPNPCLAPIAGRPLVAMAVWPADLATSAGLAANADGQVLGQDSAPIPGLYACGNDMASIMAGTYPGPGTTLGPAMVFGYRAAMHAARSGRGGASGLPPRPALR
ncbi:MAG: FAD-binding protein [Defluviicoccus sp.]|nr:FAD-binding protein [Defluviicoccus sp.]